MAHHESRTEKDLSRGITEAYLLRLNQYALEQHLISETAYHQLNVSIRTDYEHLMDRVKRPPLE